MRHDTGRSTGHEPHTVAAADAGRAARTGLPRDVYNGMPAGDLGSEGWHKPWSGPNGGSCIEAMKLGDGRVAFRQSTDPEGPALIYTPHEIESFIRGAQRGEADFLFN